MLFLMMSLILSYNSSTGFDIYYSYFYFLISLTDHYFFLLLFFIFLFCCFFSFFYMNMYIFFFVFLFLMYIFLMMMSFFLVSMSNHFMYFFWDMLGVVSFMLVLYYSTWVSLSGSLETLMSNRFGDLFLIFLLVTSDFNFKDGVISYLSFFLLLLSSSTKSAQFPFFGWLVKAMEAPTPVSSLVHSSTLVTAGYFLLTFFLNEFNYDIMILMILMSFISLMISSVLAMNELDVKQLVAWSTLSQISLVMMFFSMGYRYYSIIHLFSHAFFKSLLFLQIGFLIMMMSGDQDSRKVKGFFNYNIFVLSMIVSLFSLMSLFFLGGMLSKDLFMEFFYSESDLFYLSFLMLMSMIMTFFYSYKVMKLIMIIFGLEKSTFSLNFLIISLLFFLFSFYYIFMMMENFLVKSFMMDLSFWFWLFFLFFYLFLNFIKKTFCLLFKYSFLSDYFFLFILSYFYFMSSMEYLSLNYSLMFFEMMNFLVIKSKVLLKTKLFYLIMLIMLL